MSVLSPIVNGIEYIIHNKADFIQGKLYKGIQLDVDTLSIIKTYIINNKLTHLLNVGSHIGSMCLPISLHIDKVTAIEAYPDTYKHLCENIQHNKILNISTFNVAVGNSEEDIYFMGMNSICPVEHINRIKYNTGGMHVFTEIDISNNIRSSNLTDRKIKNKMSKLDNLDIDDFDILLVDIEGSEHEFLLGAKEKIIKNKPIIIIEIWDDSKRRMEKMKTTQQDIITYITSLNYKLIQKVGWDFIFEPF
jgi:FkbM family methyltransferase